MKKALFIFSCCTLLNISQHLFSQQLKKFSEDHDNFISELYVFMGKNISANDERILNEFKVIWDSDSLFTADEQDRIITVSQKLLNENAKASPQFSNYLLCLLTLKKSDFDIEN
ncbi:MAG: hypothetical protein JSV22_14610, partial [Bacteroidales bacterium]